jgi:hypothetical protein
MMGETSPRGAQNRLQSDVAKIAFASVANRRSFFERAALDLGARFSSHSPARQPAWRRRAQRPALEQ